jgi:hypothetical protein
MSDVPGPGGLNERRVRDDLSEVHGEPVEGLRLRRLGGAQAEGGKEYGYGVPLLLEYRAGGVDQRCVLHTMAPGPFGHQHMSALAWIGGLLSGHGVPVVLDATAPRRAHRDAGRARIERFLEVYVDTPVEVCRARDPKGIYERAEADPSNRVPGVGGVYEPPERPELTIRGRFEEPGAAAERIITALERRGGLPRGSSTGGG